MREVGEVNARRVGSWAATALGTLGIAYLVVVGVGIAQVGSDEPIVDPVLAIMEVLTLLSAPLVVILLAAIHEYGPSEQRPLTLAALAFGVGMATVTSTVHFIALTSARQMGAFVLDWPSHLYAAELLAWDVFLGLALVLAASAFSGDALSRWTRRVLVLTGTLCLLGTAGPLIGDLRVQRIGVFGYGVGLPLGCFLVARVLRGSAAGDRP